MNPLWFLAAAAAVIPVILHLINRQRAKDLPFPTLRFLRISVQKTRRRRRIQDLFLMLLRMAALILIALGLANISTSHLPVFGRDESKAVAIILDNSASMDVIDAGAETSAKGRPGFETAVAAANRIMQSLKDKDEVALFLTGGPRFPEDGQLGRHQDKVLQILGQVTTSYERADLAAKVDLARKQLVNAKAKNRVIYVLTDLQKLCWDTLEEQPDGASDSKDSAETEPDAEVSEEQQEEREIPIVIVDCNRGPKPNVAVDKVALQSTVPVAGAPVKAGVVLVNSSPAPQQRHVELYIDGAKQAGSPLLDIPSEGTKDYSFEFSFERGGLHRGEVRLVGDDGSPKDNRRFFAMEVNQGIPVAVVKAQKHEIPYLDDTFYLEQALAPLRTGASALRVTWLTSSQLASEPLAPYTAVCLVNLPAPDSAVAKQLLTYVSNGGNLIWICGENVDPAAYNQMNEQAQGKLLPAPLLEVRQPAPDSGRDSWFVGQIDQDSRVMAGLAEPASLYQSVLVYKHVRIDPGAGATVLARLDDGQPLLVQRSLGRSKLVLLGTSIHRGWTNLPLRTIFLPMFSQLIFEMADVEQQRHTGIAGSPIVIRFDEQNRPAHVEIVPPSGELTRFDTVDKQGQRAKEFDYPDTYEVGVYSVRMRDAVRPMQYAVSVNVDPAESSAKKIEEAELTQRFAPTPLHFPEDPSDPLYPEKQESLWEAFLWAVLAVLVFETFISNWFSPKKEDEQLQQLPPGMRRLAKQGSGAAA